MKAFCYAALLMVWCMLVQSEPSCDQTEFLHPNGSCVSCTVCGPGKQLSEDCGFGDGKGGVCVVCKEGRFSTDTDVAPCKRCTQCNLLNRLEKTTCSPTSDALCGQCLPGYYELRSITGEVELSCVPCYNRDTVHKECLILTAQGSKAEQVPEYCPRTEEDLLSEADLQLPPLSSIKPAELPSQTPDLAENPPRSLSSLSQENEMHPTSIVINVTTNIKPSSQKKESSHIPQEEQQSSCYSMEEMERKLQKIWEIAEGQGIEMLDYDSIQDLSLLLDSADNRNLLRRLGRSLGVPPQVITHLQGFQDLFQYLRTSTYTLLPQLAQAAALLPNPEVVARIHQAVSNK
ncbi:hypothetical protein PAMP_023239 [Pampus punctatissimus]